MTKLGKRINVYVIFLAISSFLHECKLGLSPFMNLELTGNLVWDAALKKGENRKTLYAMN